MKKYKVLFFIVSVVVPAIFGVFIWRTLNNPSYAIIGGSFLVIALLVFRLMSQLEIKKENKDTIVVFKVPIKEESKQWLDAFDYTKEVYEQVWLVDLVEDKCIIQKQEKVYSTWLINYTKASIHPIDKEKFLSELSVNTLKENKIFKCRILSKGRFLWFLVEIHFENLNSKEALILFRNINQKVESEFRNSYSELCLESQLFKVYDEILELDLSKKYLYQIEIKDHKWVRSPIFEEMDDYIKKHVLPSDYEKCKNLYPREMKIRIRMNENTSYQWYLASFRKVYFNEEERIIVYLKNIQRAWVCEEIKRKQIQRALERRA